MDATVCHLVAVLFTWLSAWESKLGDVGAKSFKMISWDKIERSATAISWGGMKRLSHIVMFYVCEDEREKCIRSMSHRDSSQNTLYVANMRRRRMILGDWAVWKQNMQYIGKEVHLCARKIQLTRQIFKTAGLLSIADKTSFCVDSWAT